MTLQNQAAITAFLQGKGFTAAQIAGVEGNLQIESSGRPTASNPREGAIGVAQWEGGRRAALQAFARSTGGSETDLATQLNFMMQELQTTEKGALTALLAATTPAAAATAFDQKYERSSAASLPARVSAAQAIAAGGITGGSGNVQTGGTGGSGGAGQGFTAAGASFTNPLTWLGSLVGGSAQAIGSWVGHFLLDAFLVLLGIILIIIAVKMLAGDAGNDRSSSGSSSGSSSSGGDDDQAAAPAPAPAPHESAAHREEHRAAAVGEDAAPVAAVA